MRPRSRNANGRYYLWKPVARRAAPLEGEARYGLDMEGAAHHNLILGRPVGPALSLARWFEPALHSARRTLFGLFGILALFAAGFAIFAEHVSQLAPPSNPDSADAIIVLTGGQARLDAALDLLRSGKGNRLLISGVSPLASRDRLRAVTGSDRDLFNCCVDIDRAALDTIGNATESAKWVTSHAYRSIILVTNNYHMPRTLLEMSRSLAGAQIKPYPVVNTRLDHGAWLTNPDALRVLLTEYTKFLAALARGALPSETAAKDLSVANASAAAG